MAGPFAALRKKFCESEAMKVQLCGAESDIQYVGGDQKML